MKKSLKLKLKLKKLLYFIYPDDCNCIACDEELNAKNRYGLCENCNKTIPYNSDRICERCGRHIENEATFCDTCQNMTLCFDSARSPFIYEGEVKKLILKYKFYNARWLAKYFAQFMADCFYVNSLKADILLPMPISKSHKRKRGYNQSILIAEYLSDILAIETVDDAVAKIKENKQQASLKLKERFDNVKGVFKVINKEVLKDKNVLIIDDILTSGNTASELARIIYRANAKSVNVLTIASCRDLLYDKNAEGNLEDFSEL